MNTKLEHATIEAPGLPATMQAAVRIRYGSPDAVTIDQVPVPAIDDIDPDEVLVRVAAAGLDRGTLHLLTGRPFAMRPVVGLRRPRQPILGRELAGTVVAVGSAVSRFAVGDEVFGIASGSMAQYTVANQSMLAPVPAALTLTEAAALPISAMTAMQSLDTANVGPGSAVLVIGASGGVGSYAVQMAAARGATVTGVCRAAKADLVHSLGAEHVIAYDQPGLSYPTATYDAIIDTGGNTPLRTLRRALARRGTLAIVGGEDNGEILGMGRQFRAVLLSLFVPQRLTFIINRERGADLERLAQLADAGAIKPALGATYPLDRTADALRHLAAGQARGKTTIAVESQPGR